MILKPEVLHRLLLAKSILSTGRSLSGQSNAHLVAKQVLGAHDAADLVFAAIADQQNRLPPGNKDSMIQCLDAIDISSDRHKGYFKQLNDARNGLKHSGLLPNTTYWASVEPDVFEKLSNICVATLSTSLDDIDESSLLVNNQVRAHLVAAKTARISQDFKLVLEELAKALFFALEDAPGLERINVGRANAEDALKLTAFGVSANNFLQLQEFLPMVSTFPSGPDWQLDIEGLLWKQSGFGHPGNWRDEVADFCISACLGVALRIQNAPPVPYAREFSDVYEYKLTAREDQVEVWEDLADEEEHRAEVFSGKARPSRIHKRFLRKGESVTISPHPRPLVSNDVSLSGELIKRVRICDIDNGGGIGAMFSGRSKRAEFVNQANVNITCVPNELYRDWSPALPEIPWEDDPLAFSL